MSLPPAASAQESASVESLAKVQKRASNEINAELTPGLIHEVNNVLTGIYFNIESCRELLDAAHPLAEAMQEIQVGVERIKEVLGRTTQIFLNAAEREQTYHEVQALVAGQIDLLRIIFPKTARITLSSGEVPFFFHVSEYAFRIALLALASCVRDIYPQGKIEIPLTILSPGELGSLGGEDFEDCVGISFRLPCVATSPAEIDDFHARNATSDLSMANTEVLIGEAGGRLLFFECAADNISEIAMVFPQRQLNV